MSDALHMRMRPTSSSRPLLLSLLVAVAAGCTTPSTADITRSDEQAASRVDGRSIASSRANPNATYLAARRIDTLETLKVLRPNHRAVLVRADGILDGAANGLLELNELVALDKPEYAPLLLDQEVELTELWSWMQVASGTTTLAPWPAQPTAAIFPPRDVSVPPGGSTKPGRLRLTTLPVAVGPAISNLQLVYDDDGDPQTVSEADLVAGLASPSPFTPAERDHFTSVRDLFALRATTSLRARIEVPKPFAKRVDLGSLGTSSLVFVEELGYFEQRRHLHKDSSGMDHRLSQIYARRLELQGAVEQDDRLVVLAPGGVERVYKRDEPTRDDLERGEYVAEIWRRGSRVGQIRFTVLEPVERIYKGTSIEQYLDFDLIADGQVLHRNLLSTSTGTGTFGHRINEARWSFETVAAPPPLPVAEGLLEDLRTPFAVDPGRYRIPLSNAPGFIVLDVYAEGAVVISGCGARPVRISMPLSMDDRARWRAPDNSCGALSIWLSGPSALGGPRVWMSEAVTLSGSMRDG